MASFAFLFCSRFDSETDIYIEMKASPAYDKSL